MITQYLVQVETSDKTKDLKDQKKFMQQLYRAADYFATLNTSGPVPKIALVKLDKPIEIHVG